MGGLGSGRRGGWVRKKVEASRSIDVNELHQAGRLRSGWRGTLQWMRDGEKIGSIGMRAERDQLHLDYCVRIGGGEWEDVVETVRLVHVPCRYGGERRYFLCPGQPGGAACGRRAGKLYASGRYFLCRHCFKLTYSSQCEDAGMRLRRKARKALRHLDGDTSDWISVQRPKGMWRVAEAREVCHRRTHPRQLFHRCRTRSHATQRRRIEGAQECRRGDPVRPGDRARVVPRVRGVIHPVQTPQPPRTTKETGRGC